MSEAGVKRDRAESDRRYRERNKAVIAEKKAIWEQEHREMGRARRARYRDKKRAEAKEKAIELEAEREVIDIGGRVLRKVVRAMVQTMEHGQTRTIINVDEDEALLIAKAVARFIEDSDETEAEADAARREAAAGGPQYKKPREAECE